jgi:predicted RNase H-like HicB family nuclease
MENAMEMPDLIKLNITLEDGSMWATVEEFPGVFATGDTLEELRASLEEGISLYLSEPGATPVSVKLPPLSGPAVQTQAHAELVCA